MRHELAERAGITSTMLIEVAGSAMDARAAMGSHRSESPRTVARARRFRRRVGRTGAGRLWPRGRLRRRRCRDATHPTVIPGRRSTTPACRSRPPACPRRHASTRAWRSPARPTRCIASTTSLARRSWPTSSTRSPPPRSRPRGGPASSTCNSCSPMFRIPRFPPTICALRSAKPWRSVPPLERPAWPGGSDRSTSSPRPARPRTADTRRPWAIERIVELPPRVRASRQPWWRRVGPLAQSRSRKPGRSPKTATAWRSGTKSRR